MILLSSGTVIGYVGLQQSQQNIQQPIFEDVKIGYEATARFTRAVYIVCSAFLQLM